MSARPYSFVGGDAGQWRVLRVSAVAGEAMQPTRRVDVIDANVTSLPAGAVWILRGAVSYERYVTSQEKNRLAVDQPPIGRPEATLAALIPIRKSVEWWQLPQDERRKIFEDRSHHIETGLHYLPAIARRLHHSYDLGEPFDFLTWFEYAPQHAGAFDELVARLRATEEWKYVVREVDIRLAR